MNGSRVANFDLAQKNGGGITTANVELNGINIINEDERKGSPRDLFWPWFAGNIGVLGLSYGAFLLDFGISFWQATIAGLVGIVLSFLLVGFIAVAGKRGSAPTMVLSRAAFGVRNKIPAALSWILCVGWETVIAALAVEATATVFGRLDWGSGILVKILALIVVVALIVAGGVMGFDVLMRIQGVITVITGVLTIGFILLTLDKIDWSTVWSIKGGNAEDVIGGLILLMTGFGLGWVNTGADYSRYLPRKVSSGAVVGWTTFAASIGPAVLLIFGLLLAGSSKSLSSAVSANPIGALAALLPTWFLVPFVIVAVLGLVGAADMDIYSSGLALLTAGLRVPRYVASGIDGTIMVLGTIYIVFFSPGNFLGPFEGFLIASRSSRRCMVRCDAGRYRDSPPAIQRCGSLQSFWYLWKRQSIGHHPHRDRNFPWMGDSRQYLRQLAQLARLPAGTARIGRKDGCVGVWKSRRGPRPSRHAVGLGYLWAPNRASPGGRAIQCRRAGATIASTNV